MKKKRKVIRISKLESFRNKVAFRTTLKKETHWFSKIDGSRINHLHEDVNKIFKHLWLHGIKEKLQKTSSLSLMTDTGFHPREKKWYIWRIDGAVVTSPWRTYSK